MPLGAAYGNSEGGSGLDLKNDHIFTDESARDSYFSANPDELEDDLYSSSNGIAHKYESGSWVEVSQLKTVKGEKGNNGSDGDSAYQIAVNNGYIGTESEWLLSLKGTNGSGGSDTATEIKTKYESNANTNAFDDAAKSKLSGIDSGAQANDINTVIDSNYVHTDNNLTDILVASIGSSAKQSDLTTTNANITQIQSDVSGKVSASDILDIGTTASSARTKIDVHSKSETQALIDAKTNIEKVGGHSPEYYALIRNLIESALCINPISYDSSENFSWSDRILLIGGGEGGSNNYCPDGYFDIILPSVGTQIEKIGGGVVAVTENGISLPQWSTLWYILPIGSTHDSKPENFRVAFYTDYDTLEPPSHWIPIATTNRDGISIVNTICRTVSAGTVSYIDTPEITPTLLNGWSHYSSPYGGVTYKRVSNIVYIQGLVSSGTLGDEVFVLPDGFRPSIRVVNLLGASGTGIARVDVTDSGAVIISSSDYTGSPTNWTTLSMSFAVA